MAAPSCARDALVFGQPVQVLEADAEGRFHRRGVGEQHLQVSQHRAGTEGPLAEGALLPVQQALGRQVGVVEDGAPVHVHLLPAGALAEPAFLDHLEEERRAWIGRGHVEEGDIERQALGEIDRLADGLLGLARQADDEVAPVHDPGFFRPRQGLFGLFRVGALAGVAQDLLVAALDAPGDPVAASLAHQLQHFLVDEVHPAVARPLDLRVPRRSCAGRAPSPARG